MNKKENLSKIDFAIIIAVITPFIYLLGFLYNTSQLFYYRIPTNFVELGIKENITTLLALIPLLLPFLVIFIIDYRRVKKFNKIRDGIIQETVNQKDFKLDSENIDKVMEKLTNHTKSQNKKLYLIIIPLFTLVLIGSILISIFDHTLYLLILLFSGMIFGLLYTIFEKWIKQGKFLVMVIVMAIILCLESCVYGFLNQGTKSEYTIVKYKKHTYVNLALYNNQFIIAPLTKDKRHYKFDFKIIDPKDTESFSSENTGHITGTK
jgi:hypothetical protein